LELPRQRQLPAVFSNEENPGPQDQAFNVRIKPAAEGDFITQVFKIILKGGDEN